MKRPTLVISPIVFSLIVCFYVSLEAQDNELRVISIKGKNFLCLASEPSPENMVWGDFGSEVESYYGVTAYSNGARQSGRKYQCTELIHRFLTEVYGIPSGINLGLGHGKYLAKNIAEFHKIAIGTSDTLGNYSIRLENFLNKKTAYPPVVGAIVSMYFDSQKKGYGHVGIIREIKINDDGMLEATLFDQHGFAHKKAGIPIQADHLLFEKDKYGNWNGHVWSWKYEKKYPVISWTNPVIVEKETIAILKED
jgi:hypothetical protein